MAAVVGMALGASMTVAAAAQAAPATAAPPTPIVCNYLDDGGGAGSANSLGPNAALVAGESFFQENVGAWRLCYMSNGEITLEAHQNQWCEADDSGSALLRTCNDNNDQLWSLIFLTSNTFLVQNVNGGVLCANGGVGSVDLVLASSNCSTYHQTWQFESSP